MCENKAIEKYENDRLLSKQAKSVVFERACPSTLAEYYKGKVSLQSLVIVSSALAKD